VSELIRHREDRVAEDALYGRGVAPTRLCRLLLPVWRVQVRATIYDSEPYDLIDRYVAAAIAEGGLESTAEVAAFYGLDPAVVGGAVRFLTSVGHLSNGGDGHLALTEIGWRSVRDGRRYTRSLEDRRQLYFDGFAHRPLASVYYDERTVTFVDGTQREDFTPVLRFPPSGLGPETLDALAELPPAERARFNLPEQVVAPSLAAAPEQVYLPAYVVRAVPKTGAVEFLAYTQASEEADPEWSRVCTTSAEVAALVENEYRSVDREGEQRAARRWIDSVFAGTPGIDQAGFAWRDHVLTVTLPVAAFADGRGPRQIGSLVKMDGGWFFRLWCDDEELRRTGLLDLANRFLGSRPKVDPDLATGRLARFGRQLGFGALDPAAIGELARNAGRDTLAAQLGKLVG
jgi:hypothetical protein